MRDGLRSFGVAAFMVFVAGSVVSVSGEGAEVVVTTYGVWLSNSFLVVGVLWTACIGGFLARGVSRLVGRG